MDHPLSFVQRFLLLLFAMTLWTVVSAAQYLIPNAASSIDRKTYVEQNGTSQWTQTVETEHHVTSDGEIEIQRLLAPAYEGDNSVSWEREVQTRKLRDGTVEREYILRNPDGSGQLAPVQIVREKSTPQGADTTLMERETLERPGGTAWQAVQDERVTEKGPENAMQAFKEIRRLNLTTHEWDIIEQETSLTSTITESGRTERETRSVRQTPDAFAKLADFERRQERTVITTGKQTTESTVYRRDNSTTDNDHFYLLDHSISEVTIAPGTITQHVVRESDVLLDNYAPTYSGHPEVVEEKTTVEKTAPDGSVHTVTKVLGRTAAEASSLRPTYTEILDLDAAGYVRRVYIPAN